MRRKGDKGLFKGWSMCDCGMRVPPGKVCPICNHDGSMEKAAVAIDRWKLKTFIRLLTLHGFEFAQGDGVTEDTLMLYVMTDDPKRLYGVIALCERKCQELRN